MALNTLEYSTIMQTALDQHVVTHSTSGWMEANAGLVKYDGGKTIKLPQMSTTGLGDYDRDEGFNRKGKITLDYKNYTMTQDRGTSFQLDAMDVTETNFVASASNAVKVFQSEHVIPEIDAFRYATLTAKAKAATNHEAVTLSAANALTKFRTHVRAVRDYVGHETPLICTITSEALALIEDNDKIQRTMSVTDFAQGEMKFKVKNIDDVIFRVVPSGRMWDKFIFETGATAFGFKPDTAGNAKAVQWIICPQNVPVAISRTDKLRVFDPDTNQGADAWKIDYRKYHDLWVLDSKLKALFACTKA